MSLGGATETTSLLVIHGIGIQRPGETLWQVVDGLTAACPDLEVRDADGQVIAPATIKDKERPLREVVLRQGGRDVRAFEVYWANLLPDEHVKASFNKFDLEETTWFPWLNWRAGLLPRDQYPRWLVILRTIELYVLQVAGTFALEFLEAFRKLRATAFDQTAADVWHYVHSLGGAVAHGDWRTGLSERILDCAEGTWTRAAEGGTRVHLVGHSLGSVVGYHLLTRRLAPGAVERFITIGSPLEKVRFLWARLFPPMTGSYFEWINYFTLADPVSGRLKRFSVNDRVPVRNERLWGVGGYGHAHIGYFRHPRVACDLASGLGLMPAARPPGLHMSWWWRRVVDVVVPTAMLVLVTLGFALFVVFFAAVIWLCGKALWLMFYVFSSTAAAFIEQWYRLIFGVLLVPGYLTLIATDGYRRASSLHTRWWSDADRHEDTGAGP